MYSVDIYNYYSWYNCLLGLLISDKNINKLLSYEFLKLKKDAVLHLIDLKIKFSICSVEIYKYCS